MGPLFAAAVAVLAAVPASRERPIVRVEPGASIPPPYVCGRRATARVLLDRAAFDRLAASPAEAFSSIEIEAAAGPAAARGAVEIFPFEVRRFAAAEGAHPASIWFAALRAPWAAVLFDPPAGGESGRRPAGSRGTDAGDPPPLRITARPGLDWIHKFLGSGPQRYRIEGDTLWIACDAHPELRGFLRASGRLEPDGIAPEGVVAAAEPLRIAIRDPGPRAWIAAGAGRRGAIEEAARALGRRRIEAELAAVRRAARRVAERGAVLRTPSADLDRFFALSKAWFAKDVRLLPFGPPYGRAALENAEVEVLTASPDYHGVFANDDIQSTIEWCLLGRDAHPVLETGLEVLWRHRRNARGRIIPEAVEFWLGGTDLFLQDALRIGQAAEWIAGAASLVLWTGDRALSDRLGPRLDEALSFFADADGDGLGEWDVSAYPEQPDPGRYRHEMLYANAWWAWALAWAAEWAAFRGERGRAEALRARASALATAIEEGFGREDGYGVWRDAQGRLHPHQGHCAIVPLACGIAPPGRAARVLRAVFSDACWLEPYGPLRANRGAGTRGGDVVWGFMRWNLIHALLVHGDGGRAAGLAGRFARQELDLGLPAPESFPRAITGRTGQGYSWTAARAIRALALGLFGLAPRAAGLRVRPVLPPGWPEMALLGVPFRGCTIDATVRRASHPSRTLNGRRFGGAIVPASALRPGRNELVITVPRS